MNKGYFTDKTTKPTDTEIQDILGTAKSNWNFLLRFINDNLTMKVDFKFYGVNYGWALRFKRSGKSIIAFYPDKDCFTLQIILNKAQAEHALSDDLGAFIKNTNHEIETIREGKWIFIKADPTIELRDILRLIIMRFNIK